LPAICDPLFEKLSFEVEAHAIIAHIRRATAGHVQRRNCHPFRFGDWIFAHNGHVQEFPDVREEILTVVLPEFRDNIESDTDSEVFFRLFLSFYSKRADVNGDPDHQAMVGAVDEAIATIRSISEPLARSKGNENPCWLSCLVSCGQTMMAVSSGKPMAMRVMEVEETGKQVFLSSEEIATRGLLDDGTNWIDIRFGQAVVIDAELNVEHFYVDTRESIFA